MQIKSYRLLAAALILLLALPFGVSAAPGDPQTYSKTIQPLPNGFGITSILETEPSTDPLYVNRYVGGAGISSAFTIGGNQRKIFGALLDFGSVPGGMSNANDVIGFNITFDATSPNTLNIWRSLVGTTDPMATNNIRSFGLGGVSQNGKISLRMDGFSGGIGGQGHGVLDASAPIPTTFYNYADSTYYKLLSGGTSCTTTITVSAIGEKQDLVVGSSFGNFLVAMRSNIPGGGGCLNPHAINIASGQHRGTLGINDTAKVMAIFAKDASDQSDQVTKLRVIKYIDNGSSITITSNNEYSFKNTIPGYECSGANFFSQTAYRGPQQISINDNGDIAFPIVITNPGATTWRTAGRRGILMMPADSPGTFKVVCDNASPSSIVYYDPAETFTPCIGGVAIDNSRNVFFSGSNWMGLWFNGTSTEILSTNCIFKAVVNNPLNPTNWTIEPILWRGCAWKEGTDVLELALLPLYNTGSEWFNNPAAFGPININRTVLPSQPTPAYSIGGLFVAGAVGIKGQNGLRMRGFYVAPTTEKPAADSIYKALRLPDSEPVNLINCVITATGDPYVSPSGATYYQYYITDESRGRIRISTVRNDLQIGDKLYVSGITSTDTITGERWLSSGGVVLVGRNATMNPRTMNCRAVKGAGLSTEGMYVRVFGKIVATGSGYFDISDGSADTVRIYTSTVPTGTSALVDGDVLFGSRSIQVRNGDQIVFF